MTSAIQKSFNNLGLFKSTSLDTNNFDIKNKILNDYLNTLDIIDPDDLSHKDLSLILKNIDDYDGYFTTQQVQNIEYSNFSEHVFFDSAVNKVSYAFNKILDFPFDKNEIKYKEYINSLDGYTSYVLKNIFPKNVGYIKFDGTNKVRVINQQGILLNDHLENKAGLLNPGTNRFCFNFWIKVDDIDNNSKRVVFKKFDEIGKSGFICFVDNVGDDYYINFKIQNGTDKLVTRKTKIEKDKFLNIAIYITNESNKRNVTFAINGNPAANDAADASILTNEEFSDEFKSLSTHFVIGSCESLNDYEDFKGYIDEFRYFMKIKSLKEVKREMDKNIFPQSGLALYLKFNEPSGNYNNNFVCIDSSGNRLHGLILNKNDAIESDTSNYRKNDNLPITNERNVRSPVVNASFSDLKQRREALLKKAKDFDDKNPNIIFKLMPKHYFLSAADQQNLPIYSSEDVIEEKSSIEGTIANTTNNFLSNQQPANNHLVNIVLIWARFFDQLKIYIDSLTNMLNVDYDTINSDKIIGMQIPIICKRYGLEFKEIFPSISADMLSGKNLVFEDIINEKTIRKIQNILWYRLLLNSKGFLSSKGTVSSFDQILGSLGVENRKLFSIREYSSSSDLTKKNNFYKEKHECLAANFATTSLIDKEPQYSNDDAFSDNKLHIETSDIKHFLANNVKQGIVDDDDIKTGLGNDWSIEAFIDYNSFSLEKNSRSSYDLSLIQNILRIDVGDDPVVTIELIRYNHDSNKGKLKALVKPDFSSSSYNVELEIDNIDLFSREKYFILQQKTVESILTYSITFGNANKTNSIDDVNSISASKDLSTVASGDLTFAKSNMKIRIGNYKYSNNTAQLFALDNTDFDGEFLSLRLWNKFLSNEEITTHMRDMTSIGVESKDSNHLISDFSIDPESVEGVENSKLTYTDRSGNKKKVGESFESINSSTLSAPDDELILQSIKYKEVILDRKNILIDQPIKQNRVNILSYESNSNKSKTGVDNKFPTHSVPEDFDVESENRLTIDMSVVTQLNSDITRMIADINDFTKQISNSQSMYEYSYKNLEIIRNSYFSKFDDKNYIKYSSIISVFKYFDNILSDLLFKMMPSRTNYKGFNVVYESHALERHKYEHKNRFSNIEIVDYLNYQYYSRDLNSERKRRDIDYNRNRMQIENTGDN